jgi:ureidoacrylate peracid hydrolase
MIGDEKYLSAPVRAQYLRNHGHPRRTCVQEGTWGADFYDDLRPSGHGLEVTIDKHRYSACIGTRLDQTLRTNGIETIVVAGVATSGCVESTVRDAFMLDYYVVVARDACGDYDVDRHEAALRKMDLSFGYVIAVEDIETTWARQLARL